MATFAITALMRRWAGLVALTSGVLLAVLSVAMPALGQRFDTPQLTVSQQLRSQVDLFLYDVRWNLLHRLTNTPETEQDPHWSPDGRFLAYTVLVEGVREVFIQDVYGGEAVQLTRSRHGSDAPLWSPAQPGTMLLRYDRFPGQADIVAVRLPEYDRRNLTVSNSSERDLAWSPDGAHIVYTAIEPDGVRRVRVMRYPVGDVVWETLGAGFDPAWSPDGTRFAYIGETIGAGFDVANTLHIVDWPSGTVHDLPVNTPVMSSLLWTEDSLYFIAVPEDLTLRYDVYQYTFANGTLKQRTQMGIVRSIAWEDPHLAVQLSSGPLLVVCLLRTDDDLYCPPMLQDSYGPVWRP